MRNSTHNLPRRGWQKVAECVDTQSVCGNKRVAHSDQPGEGIDEVTDGSVVLVAVHCPAN